MNFLDDLAEPLPVYVIIGVLLGWPPTSGIGCGPGRPQIVRLYEKDHSAEDKKRGRGRRDSNSPPR